MIKKKKVLSVLSKGQRKKRLLILFKADTVLNFLKI